MSVILGRGKHQFALGDIAGIEVDASLPVRCKFMLQDIRFVLDVRQAARINESLEGDEFPKQTGAELRSVVARMHKGERAAAVVYGTKYLFQSRLGHEEQRFISREHGNDEFYGEGLTDVAHFRSISSRERIPV